MKTESYTCDECGLPIDGKQGPPSLAVGAEGLCQLAWSGMFGDNRFASPRHYHRFPCMDAVIDRIIPKK